VVFFSKRSLEGYALIDHRESPGLTPEDAAICPDGIPVGRGQLFESAFITCSHCQRGVVLNPDRTRERGYCRKCDKYICDQCTAALHNTGICRPYAQLVDEILEAALKAE
jgi:hypothetical protein